MRRARNQSVTDQERRPPGLPHTLHRLLFSRHLDLLERVEFPLSSSGANLARFLPVLAFLEIRVPKGPGAALDRSRLINRALASPRVQQDAIPIGILDQELDRGQIS